MGAPISVVSAFNTGAGTTLGVVQSPNPTAGHRNYVSAKSAPATTTVGDALANGYTAIGNVIGTGLGLQHYHFDAPITTGGSANTVTASFSASVADRQITVAELAASALQAGNQSTDSGTSNPTPNTSVTCSAVPATGVAFGDDESGGAIGVGSGYTSGGLFTDGQGQASSFLCQYQAFASTGTKTANFATNFDRTTQVFAIYTDTPLPVIGTPPQSAVVADGDIALFSVAATASVGGGSLSYQWQKGGVNVGSNSASLALQGFIADNGSAITVAVTDSNGTVTSTAARLNVIQRIYRRSRKRRARSTYDFSGAGWFDASVTGAGNFDRDVIAPASTGPVASLAVTEAPDTVAAGATAAEAANLAVTEANDTLVSAATAPSSGLNAALAVTEAPDTVAAAATAAEAATAAITEANDTVASAATAAEAANFAITEAPDTLASAASAGEQANAAITEANDTLVSASGGSVSASLAVTEVADTVVSAATAAEAASASITEAPDTVASAATAAEVASLAVTEAPDTVVSTASGAAGANAAITEADDTLGSAAAAAEVANATITEAPDTLVSAATAPAPGLNAALAVTESPDALSSSSSADGSASAAVTEADDVLVAAAASTVGASLAVTEADDTLVSDATAAKAANAAITEADDTVVSAASIALSASAAITEDPDQVFAAAAVTALVNAAIAEANDSLHATASTSSGGGASADDVWNYVLSNGLTAGETLAQALQHATNCCG